MGDTRTRNTRVEAGAPYGIRTRVLALRGPRPRPLDEGSRDRKRVDSRRAWPAQPRQGRTRARPQPHRRTGQKPVDKGSPERGSLGNGPGALGCACLGNARAIAHIRCSARAHAVWRCMITFVSPHSPWPERSRVARSNQLFFEGGRVGRFVDSRPPMPMPSASNRSTPEWTPMDSEPSPLAGPASRASPTCGRLPATARPARTGARSLG